MRIILETEHAIRLVADGAALSFEPAAGAGAGPVPLSPFHLLAASLALCTWSVLEGWATQAGLATSGLDMGVEWAFGADPVRVSDMRLDIVWPALPAERWEAARRAAAQCTVHHTLDSGTRVETVVTAGEESGA